MDINQFDLKAEAEEGAFCHLASPHDGSMLYDGDTAVGVYILGNRSDSGKRAMHQLSQKMAGKKLERASLQDYDKINAATAKAYASMTTGWEGLSDGGDASFSKEKVEEFYAKQDWALAQVAQFVADSGNFTKRS